MMKRGSKLYLWGLVLTIFGGAGLAEVVTSDRGSFLISAIVFAVGFAMIIGSYANE